ncbi:MAG: transposase [Burkholderiaceae bacterium]
MATAGGGGDLPDRVWPARRAKVLTIRGAPTRVWRSGKRLCADIDGFSLHAAVRVKAHERGRLEKLCRYITRPALAEERIEMDSQGQVRLRLKTPWTDGTTHLVLSPIQLMQRLAALVPRPRLHLIRFHGVLAPNARLRARCARSAGARARRTGRRTRRRRAKRARAHWLGAPAQASVRYRHDPLSELRAGKLKILAAILERAAIEKILNHLGIDAQAPPRGKARMPGADQAW